MEVETNARVPYSVIPAPLMSTVQGPSSRGRGVARLGETHPLSNPSLSLSRAPSLTLYLLVAQVLCCLQGCGSNPTVATPAHNAHLSASVCLRFLSFVNATEMETFAPKVCVCYLITLTEVERDHLSYVFILPKA